MDVEPALELAPVLAFSGRPGDLGERAGAGKGHILDLAPVEQILRPVLGLAAEDAFGLFGSEIFWDGLEFMDLLRGQGAANHTSGGKSQARVAQGLAYKFSKSLRASFTASN